MPLLVSKPASINRGTKTTLQLSSASLVALVSDSYFQDLANWKKVILYYKDATSKQKTYVIVNVGTSQGSFSVSSKAIKNTWQLYKVMIEDFDGGVCVLSRTTAGTSDDITVSGT